MTTFYDESYPPSLWEEAPGPVDGREDADPFDEFTGVATITAQDLTNAAKLGPLGFIASPLTPWLAGERITVNTFLFHWNGTIWVPGVVPGRRAAPRGSREAPVVPQDSRDSPSRDDAAQEDPEAPGRDS
jgi:hypothetical protein